MKILLAILALSVLSGCASLGKVMQGAGQGLAQSSQRNDTMNCTQNGFGGYTCESE